MHHFLAGETDTTGLNPIASENARKVIEDRQFLYNEIQRWKNSDRRKWQIEGENYYDGKQDILKKKREAIGQNGNLEEVTNLPNAKIVDNQYALLVDKKVNYSLGKPPTISTENKQYAALLQKQFGPSFHRTWRAIGKNAINGAVGWLMPYYDDQGELAFKRFAPYSILPFWADEEHKVLDAAVHLYEVLTYEQSTVKIVEHVEALTDTGIYYFVLDSGALVPEAPFYAPYMTINGLPFNWERIPLIAWKFTSEEIPLLRRVKSLQDGINLMESSFQDRMLEDPRNTIIVAINYAGTDVSDLRHNLATYGVVHVVNDSTAPGGDVKTLTIDVNAENYKTILKLLKDALIENGRGYDAKDDRMGNNPNQMNIQSMYSDIDLDAAEMETEFRASFDQLLWFVNAHFANTGQGDYSGESVDVTFNRNILINNDELIQQIKDSTGLVSDRTLLQHHPFVEDVEKELKEINKQRQEELDQYGDAFKEPVTEDE